MRTLILQKDPLGQYIRQRQIWEPSRWDDGYIDGDGRFRVYRPDCPRAYRGGYALRAHVVWWLNTGSCHPVGTNLHHINHIRTDDRFENLALMDHGKHTALHCTVKPITLFCRQCNKPYQMKVWKYLQRLKDGWSSKFCSQECYRRFPRIRNRMNVKCEVCETVVSVIPSQSHRKCCSKACAAKLRSLRYRHV